LSSSNSIYRKFLASLEAAELPCVVLRDDLNAVAPIKDLDLLIDESRYLEFTEAARLHGFFPVRSDYLNPHKVVFLNVVNGEPAILDVHLHMVYKGLVFLDAASMLSRRIRRDGHAHLSAEDFAISLLFHNILAKKCIQQKHLHLLKDQLSRAGDAVYIQKHLRSFGLFDIYKQATQDLDFSYENPEFVENLAAHALKKVTKHSLANRLWALKKMWRKKRLQYAGKSRGVCIAFLGPDGAGKSTTIKAIQARLNEIGLGGSIVYLGPWGGSILKLKKFFRWLRPGPLRQDYKDFYEGRTTTRPGRLKGMASIKFGIQSSVYWILLIIEMHARWYLRVMPQLRKGRVVLADRYIYDILTGYKNRPMDYHVALRERLCRSYPKPDIGILLDSDPQIIFRRKPQLNEQQLLRAREAYHEIAERFDFRILDTSISVDDTLAAFEKKILPAILTCYKDNKR